MNKARTKLVEQNLALVQQIAGRIAKRLPSCVDMDELVSAGNLGLVQAAAVFDSSRHANFAVFARFYIHGRIIDSVRGPRYPRRYESLPEEWTHGVQLSSGDPSGGSKAGKVPEMLIDRSSPLEVLIEHQECVVVSISAHKARQTLDPHEGAVLDQHLEGKRLTLIGKNAGRSGAWAHTTLERAKVKMRARLEREREAA